MLANFLHSMYLAMQRMIDWLLFGTLAIEREKPAMYGWRQNDDEANSVLKRYFFWDVRQYMPGGAAKAKKKREDKLAKAA